ncbi:DUF6443 domain-containing protein [Roseivirga sp.]|uniref:DUF6443 domain-containing protein n=1 Tax=Roseivirga sp. TaxID=1964215 RepID=UPI003B52D43B
MHTQEVKFLLIILLFSVVFPVEGQIKPVSGDRASKTSTLPTTSYQTDDKVSYVRTFDFYKAMTTETGLSTEITNGNVMQATQYVDGLGRPIQSVARRALPGGKDLVQYMVYDAYGRQVYQPMAFQSDYGDGRMHLSPSARLNTFMNGNGTAGSGFYPHEDIFYGLTSYENSPLNRPLKQMSPGNSWAGSSNGVSSSWRTNNSTDDVRRWTAGASSASSPGTYAIKSLTVSIVTDEEGNQVREFTDKLGRVVLKRVQKGASTADGRSNWMNTYYVYDDYGNLRFVLPPRAEEVLSANSWSWNTTDMNALAFHYTYDDRNRMITKRVPGGGLVEMVYDKLDRLVLTRDANMTTDGKWLFTKYDDLNRPVLTGFINSSNTRATMQTQANASAVFNVSTEPLDMNNVLEANSISLSYHISGTAIYRSKTTIEFLPGFDSNGEYFETEIVPALSSDYTFVQGYHDATFPSLKDYTEEVLTVSYYDNYDFTLTTYDSGQEVDFHTAGTNNAIDPTVYSSVEGMATGSRVKVLGSADEWLTTVMFYDDRNRVIQTVADNHLGSQDINTTQYDFSGKVLNTYTEHNNPQASGSESQTTIAKRFTYENSGTGRLLNIQQKINGGSYKTFVTNTYDDLGQLITKKLDNPTTPLETLNFDYTVRGWLEGINKDYVNGGSGHYFGMTLSYDHGFTQNQLNGNIAGVKWKSTSSSDVRAYGFTYDESNRLELADYTQGSSWLQTENDYSTSYGYDVNGNITSLMRMGTVAGNILTIDNLTYTYNNSGKSNQLQKVADAAGDLGQGDFVDGNTGTTDYTYDGNGNMITDLNKDIQSGDITYNHLNLPETITFGNSSTKTITYTYDAAGIKLAKTVNNGGEITVTDYVAGFIYENDELQHFAHEEGRVRKNNEGTLVYDYYVKDHLGNTRMTLTEDDEVAVYIATMETEYESFEESLFLNMDASRVTSTSGNYTVDGSITANEASRLNGSDANRRSGPGKLMAVTAGDQVDLEVYARYDGTIGSSTGLSQSQMVTAIAATFGGISGGTTEQQSIYNLFNTNSGYVFVGGSSSQPRAYLNYILFDQDFGYITSGHDQVTSLANGAHEKLSFATLSITEGGYLYVFVSNESAANFDVFFDDLRITHTKGAILQEDHYYPFGMNIQALSSNAPLSKPNQYKFNGIEENTEFDINVYDAFYRNYDPVLGRWWQVDPKASERESPYVGMSNNPILYNDYLGDTVSFAAIVLDDKINNTNNTETMLSQLSSITGLNLFLNKSGYLDFEKDDNGNAIISNAAEGAKETEMGSESAREDLFKAINGGMISVDKSNRGSKTNPETSEVFMDFDAIRITVDKTSDKLNKLTMGVGMTFMHELQHTFVGNKAIDPVRSDLTSTGDAVDRVNTYRRELDNGYGNGAPYGQRTHYNAEITRIQFTYRQQGKNQTASVVIK